MTANDKAIPRSLALAGQADKTHSRKWADTATVVLLMLASSGITSIVAACHRQGSPSTVTNVNSRPAPVQDASGQASEQVKSLQEEGDIYRAIFNGKIAVCQRPAVGGTPATVEMLGGDALADDDSGSTQTKVSRLALEIRAGTCSLTTPAN